jgi:CheY-like chemotaxis protein
MKKKKILVVDDELAFLDTIKNRLEANNYKVVTASSGKVALDKVEKDKPDAILLDILMPGLDGLEVLKKIRKKDKNLPVFIVSAYFNEERFKKAGKLNASGFIIKTGDLEKEITNINHVLRLAERHKRQ